MAADNMRLRVVLDLVERVVAPLKRISTGSTDAPAHKIRRDSALTNRGKKISVSRFAAPA